MLLPQLVQNISSIKPSIVAQLARNDLQRLGIRIDEKLRLASNSSGMIPQEPATSRTYQYMTDQHITSKLAVRAFLDNTKTCKQLWLKRCRSMYIAGKVLSSRSAPDSNSLADFHVNGASTRHH